MVLILNKKEGARHSSAAKSKGLGLKHWSRSHITMLKMRARLNTSTLQHPNDWEHDQVTIRSIMLWRRPSVFTQMQPKAGYRKGARVFFFIKITLGSRNRGDPLTQLEVIAVSSITPICNEGSPNTRTAWLLMLSAYDTPPKIQQWRPYETITTEADAGSLEWEQEPTI